jgi:hypothetical protein
MEAVADVPINGAYTAVTPGTPPTGGIAITASQFGLQYIEWAQVNGSDNGQYDGVVYLTPFELGQPATGGVLQVIVSATGAEASGTIAAGRSMRLLVKGY